MQVGLEHSHLAAHGRPGDIEDHRRSTENAELGDADEVFELFPIYCGGRRSSARALAVAPRGYGSFSPDTSTPSASQ